MGRFLKPDNIIPDLKNPQNWNAYTYVKGNPVNFNDPSGHILATFYLNSFEFGLIEVGEGTVGTTGLQNYQNFGTWTVQDQALQDLEANINTLYGKMLSADHDAFKNLVWNIEKKEANLPQEGVSIFKSIYRISSKYENEIAFYISLTDCREWATVLVFGDQIKVNPSLSENEVSFFERTIGYYEKNLLVFGHTHPREGKRIVLPNGKVFYSGMGVSEADKNYYVSFWWNNSSQYLIVLQMTYDSNLIMTITDFYDCNSAGRITINLGGN